MSNNQPEIKDGEVCTASGTERKAWISNTNCQPFLTTMRPGDGDIEMVTSLGSTPLRYSCAKNAAGTTTHGFSIVLITGPRTH